MEFNDYIEFIKKKHGTQKRIQGTPYYLHPLEVAILLKEKGLPEEYQIAGLFHDLLEDTNTTYEEILNITNIGIAEAVRLVTKEKGYDMAEYMQRIRNNDIARMVKIVDRIHNLSEAHLASEKFQKKYIKETEDWFFELARGTIFEKELEETLNKLIEHINEENFAIR